MARSTEREESEKRLRLEVLRGALDYDTETGVFTWVATPRLRSALIGQPAGYSDPRGYRVIHVKSRGYYAHRLAWFYTHGEWPPNQIDHINMDKSDNRIANLRLATMSQNQQNQQKRKLKRPASSPFKGVHWHRAMKTYVANICKDGQQIHLGTFGNCAPAAHFAYCVASDKLHGEFGRAA